MNSVKRVRALISGRVQGVFFRVNTKHRAVSLGLFGWVKNNQDGTVEAVFEGEDKKIEEILKWCRKGPFFASVKDIKVFEESYKREFNSFSVR